MMAEIIACLKQGKIELLLQGQPAARLLSPYQETLNARGQSEPARIVAVTRGRTRGELCYAIAAPEGASVFAQVLGSGAEERLFFGADARISEIDFGKANQALVCTVRGKQDTSFIGVLADDGRGMRTVTEGDVIDCYPRWAAGGRPEVLYASAGIGRTSSGTRVGLSPFALHRLRFADSSVEVLVADARYDYLAAVQIAEQEFLALRSSYRASPPPSTLTRLAARFPSLFPAHSIAGRPAAEARELVRISRKGSESLVQGVLAFDVAGNGDIVYSTDQGVFGWSQGSSAAQLSPLSGVVQLSIC